MHRDKTLRALCCGFSSLEDLQIVSVVLLFGGIDLVLGAGEVSLKAGWDGMRDNEPGSLTGGEGLPDEIMTTTHLPSHARDM